MASDVKSGDYLYNHNNNTYTYAHVNKSYFKRELNKILISNDVISNNQLIYICDAKRVFLISDECLTVGRLIRELHKFSKDTPILINNPDYGLNEIQNITFDTDKNVVTISE